MNFHHQQSFPHPFVSNSPYNAFQSQVPTFQNYQQLMQQFYRTQSDVLALLRLKEQFNTQLLNLKLTQCSKPQASPITSTPKLQISSPTEAESLSPLSSINPLVVSDTFNFFTPFVVFDFFEKTSSFCRIYTYLWSIPMHFADFRMTGTMFFSKKSKTTKGVNLERILKHIITIFLKVSIHTDMYLIYKCIEFSNFYIHIYM